MQLPGPLLRGRRCREHAAQRIALGKRIGRKRLGRAKGRIVQLQRDLRDTLARDQQIGSLPRVLLCLIRPDCCCIRVISGQHTVLDLAQSGIELLRRGTECLEPVQRIGNRLQFRKSQRRRAQRVRELLARRYPVRSPARFLRYYLMKYLQVTVDANYSALPGLARLQRPRVGQPFRGPLQVSAGARAALGMQVAVGQQIAGRGRRSGLAPAFCSAVYRSGAPLPPAAPAGRSVLRGAALQDVEPGIPGRARRRAPRRSARR